MKATGTQATNYDFSGIDELSVDSKINILRYLTGRGTAKALNDDESFWVARILMYQVRNGDARLIPKQLDPESWC